MYMMSSAFTSIWTHLVPGAGEDERKYIVKHISVDEAFLMAASTVSQVMKYRQR